MNNGQLTAIQNAVESEGPARALDELVEQFRATGQYEQMFDALMMKARWDLDLPLTSPAGFQGVPEDQRAALEKSYIEAARTVGDGLLASGDIPRAWIYFRTIGETEPIAKALDEVDAAEMDYEPLDELIEIALREGANRVAGLRLLLASHGTCNTVTMTEQALPMMMPDERRQAAALLVRDIHRDVRNNLDHIVSEREGGDHANESIHALITDRDWLFEGPSYHIDVSHLSATVRFARALTRDDPELPLAVELAEYGGRLDEQFRFPADPPFDDYYAAHEAFLKALGDIDRDESLDYFRDRLASEQDERDRQMTAYVLVDLLTSCQRRDEAAEVAAKHLGELEEPNGFSFSALCGEAGRWDLLQSVAEANEDPLRFAAAVIEQHRTCPA